MIRLQRLRYIWLVLDLVCFTASATLAMLLLDRTITQTALGLLGFMALVRITILVRTGMYRAVLRYSGLHTLFCICRAIALGTAITVAAAFFIGEANFYELGRAFLVMEALLSISLCGATRLGARLFYDRICKRGGRHVLIYGSGSLGEMTLRNLERGGHTVVGFIDDAKRRHKALIHGRQVLGRPEMIPTLIERCRIDLVVVAIRDLHERRLKDVFRLCMKARIPVKLIKGMDQLMEESQTLDLKDISLEDLLHRPARDLDPAPVRELITGKVIAITGAGGSIGSEISHQVLLHGASKILLIDHSEFNLYQCETSIRDRLPNTDNPTAEIIPILCNICDSTHLERHITANRPDVIFHAAAYKHVPLVENNPFFGLKNNVQGTLNVITIADQANIENLVLISTDKAVRPTNVMGASKRVCELLLQNYQFQSTKACAVRFGNVLGSSGSVIPRFVEQIRNGGPVTVTHPEMTRYFMLIPEAVRLVLHAGAMAQHGEIFILDMGDPVKIDDLARDLIFLAGHIPDVTINVVHSGLRPGEKLYEELLINDAEQGTAIDGITIAKPAIRPYERLQHRVESMLQACQAGDMDDVLVNLKALVPEWAVSKQTEAMLKVTPTVIREHKQSRDTQTRLAAQ